ncbi:helix-turn-helix domain-containing protein [Caloramator sp. E03]|uniref:helix-turn-helix domain-containing protein n=1 Tax=Caloramator sp. E03 TaxID=2576307 RepID=UPI0011105127|nr:S24 family peptidase [Caloramator sp. E03]QCX33715.1 helix-turn-helix domain-containing protein [Caloramator sp. E03]
MSRVGEKIQDARQKAGIPIKALAKKLGVSEGFIADVESGRRIINEELIKKIEKLLEVNLNEELFDEVQEPIENIKEVDENKFINKQWEDAFAHILKKIPVCSVNLKEIYGYVYLPVIEKKIEGYPSDKLFYIKVPDDSMRGFRIAKDDKVLVYETSEILSNSICLIDIDGKKCIRQIKRVDANKALIISHSNDLKTETKDVKSFTVIGRCIKLESEL